jgi:DNA-3-methyladenine glycosylase
VSAGPLPRSWFTRDALVVAPELLGARLVREDVVLRITEVEAYRWPGDTACHARHGRTARTAPMFEQGGVAYVYLCYGLHNLLNVVTGGEGEAQAVLVRSVVCEQGEALVVARRGGRMRRDLLVGPGKVGAALALDPSWSGHPLFEEGGLEVQPGEPPAGVRTGPRVGIGYADPEHQVLPWRFQAI